MLSLEQRFWEKVVKLNGDDACWIWIGAADVYGYTSVEGTQQLAHRVSWEVHFGPPGDLFVLHRCDTPLCVRPSHLFLGTQADNIADRTQKKRHASGETHGSRTRPDRVPQGERHGMSKLTDVEVHALRVEYANGGVSQPQLARKYELAQATVSSILLGKTRRAAGGPIHVKQAPHVLAK